MLSNVTALITGGASGLGRAAARHILIRGGSVIIADLPHQKSLALSLPASLPPSSFPFPAAETRLFFAPTDVTSPDDVSAALDFSPLLPPNHSHPNVVVNCAGIATPGRIINKRGPLDLEKFQQVLNVNTVGTFNVCRLAAERMATAESFVSPNVGDDYEEFDAPDNERGVIINTASIAAFDGQIGQAAYAASKGAISSLTLTLARDLADKQIRCVGVAPGLFLTPLLEGLPEKVRTEMGEKVSYPNRLGDPREFGLLIGGVIGNRMLNGEVIRIDGAYRLPP